MAHIVDMHQLTKDPEPLLLDGPSTPSSPERKLTPFELGRYLDYSSEMLSMISKTAAIREICVIRVLFLEWTVSREKGHPDDTDGAASSFSSD